MDYIVQKLRLLSSNYWAHYEAPKPKQQRKELSKILGYCEYAYNVLTWENPTFTWVVFLALNFLFWFIIQFEIRIFGVVFALILVAFISDNFLELRPQNEINEGYYDAVENFNKIWRSVTYSMIALRRESPSSFCFAMTLFFLVLSFIAKNISGHFLAYLSFVGIFFIPIGISKIPEETKKIIKDTLLNFQSETATLAEEELIPFLKNKNLLDRDNDLDSFMTDKTAESATNSLVSGISMMPSYLEDEDSPEIREEDLIPTRDLSLTPGDLSTDSDSDYRPIRFDSGHYNGDTSSDDEKIYQEGLAFHQNTSQDTIDSNKAQKNDNSAIYPNLGNLLNNVATMGTNMVSTALHSVSNMATAQANRQNSSSSESEFEIINPSEIDT